MSNTFKKQVPARSVRVLAACALLAALQVQAAEDIGKFRGQTFGEWSASWWQWAFSFQEGFPNGPPFAAGVVDCGAGQSGAVWFLAGTGVATGAPLPGPGEALQRTCRDPIPNNVALFFPLLNIAMFNPDPTCGDDQTCTVAEKRQIADQVFSDTVPGPFNSQACKLKASVDGQPVHFLDYPLVRTQSPLFTLMGDPETASDGYWVMLPPLGKGDHTIEISGNLCEFNNYAAPVLFGIDVRYSISVR